MNQIPNKMYSLKTLQLRIMKYFSFLTLAIIACISCQNPNVATEKEINPLPVDRLVVPYDEFIEEIQNLPADERQGRFFSFINRDIPNYWTGTPWDFNGTTREPRQGNIACGYFVTNVLSDFKMDIQRVYLAQQASSVMINELCEKGSVKRFAEVDQVEKYLSQRGEKEIYIVGLDFHTGFVIRDGDENYFLHANYIEKAGVMKEVLSTSSAFTYSKSFMIGSLSENDKLFLD
jgi:hypothetical protein